MKKRILSFAIAFVMASICFGTLMTEPAAAATQYMTINADYGSDEIGAPREKVGKYYIWVEHEINNNVTKDQLKCAASLKKKAKVLKTVRAKSKELISRVITNGSTVFYLVQEVNSSGRAKCTIYKTTVKSGKSKKIKTITNIAGTDDIRMQLAAYYNGRIYYNVSLTQWYGDDPIDMGTDLYSCTLSGKGQRLEKKNYVVHSSYGKYMTGNIYHQGLGKVTQTLYNMQTGTSKKLIKAMESVVYGNSIYYSSSFFAPTISKSGLDGKRVSKIKTVKNGFLSYLGKKHAYFSMENSGVIKKLVYKTKKLTTVR